MYSLLRNKNPLGAGLRAGSRHHRAYVGPPRDYDLVAAMCFNLLTCSGLRQNHRVLDVGCGSLRLGRLLIPYLNRGNYFGVEPNPWLIKDGVRYEVGRSLVNIKRPKFIVSDNISDRDLRVDFAVAQSIFSHTKLDMFESWVRDIAGCLSEKGCLFATIVLGDNDEQVIGEWDGDGQWVYPNCVTITEETVNSIAKKYRLKLIKLDYFHPRQTWFAFCRDSFDDSLLEQGRVEWNRAHR